MDKLQLRHYKGREEVADREWELAMEASTKFIAKKLEKKDCGEAMAEGNFGMPAAEHFVFQAFNKLYKGEWEWSQRRALHTQLIRIAMSDIHHYLAAWKKKDHPEQVELDEKLADRLKDDEDFLDVVYEIAERAAAGDKDLLDYLNAMRRCNDYKLMAEALGIELREVYQRQRKLLRRIEKEKSSTKNTTTRSGATITKTKKVKHL